MAYHNTVKLIGNLGSEAKIIEGEKKTFAALRIATTDSYKDKETEEWKDKATIWHDVIIFNPTLIEEVKAYKTGVRLEIDGSLSYREFLVSIEEKEVTKREASVLAHKIQQAPLVKKDTAE